MKQIKNERGFTLIELLAVIVVLAIVLLMGAMAVIPRMNDARKQVFALEANTAIQGATTFLMNNALKAGGKNFPTSAGQSECVSIKELMDDGIVDFNSNYKGYVIVQKKSNDNNIFLYQITMTNGSLVAYQKGVKDGANVDITSDMIDGFTTQEVPETCPTETPKITTSTSTPTG